MKALLDEKTLKKFDTKTLFQQVTILFDDYNTKQFMINNNIYKSYNNHPTFLPEELKSKNYDPTWNNFIKHNQYNIYLKEFDKKINFLKTQFTEEELTIFKYSIEERELDKMIISRINKSEHRYYQIKKSCYLKVALTFGIITPIKKEMKTN